MATNPATQSARRKRLRAVERMVLDGSQTGEIFDKLGKKHKVAYPTIRKDVVDVRKAHLEDIDKATELEGSASYLARTIALRIEAREAGDLKLVHTLNQELARMFGVNLKIDDKNYQLTLNKAIDHMESIISAVFSVIKDKDLQDQIIEAVDAIAAE